jgi:hypothetical protein
MLAALNRLQRSWVNDFTPQFRRNCYFDVDQHPPLSPLAGVIAEPCLLPGWAQPAWEHWHGTANG